MGTTTWTEACPRCGDGDFTAGRDRESGEFGFCVRCGYGYRQQEYQMTLADVNDMRKDLELQPLNELAPALPDFAWRQGQAKEPHEAIADLVTILKDTCPRMETPCLGLAQGR